MMASRFVGIDCSLPACQAVKAVEMEPVWESIIELFLRHAAHLVANRWSCAPKRT